MKKFYIILVPGLILSLIMFLVPLIAQQKCTQNIGCIIYSIIPYYPGLILNLEGTIVIIVSLIFWFLTGALIGFLIYKYKK